MREGEYLGNMKRYQSLISELNIKLEYHGVLNPKLWDGFSLKRNVRERLLIIADMWRDFLDIDKDKVTDIIMTGRKC